MSYYVSSREEQRQARSPLNYKPAGLPSDHRRGTERAQRRDDLERHFSHDGDRSRAYKPSRTAYQDAGLSRAHRHKISEVRSATRAALGPSFDPFDESTHEPSRRRDHDYGRPRGWTGDVAPPRTADAIPQRYLQEFNQRWHEYDEDHDADQLLADLLPNAPWRNHVPMDPRDHYRGEPSTHLPQPRPRTVAPVRSASSVADITDVRSGIYDDSHHAPSQSSTFAWDPEPVESVHEKSKCRFRLRDLVCHR